MGEVTEYIPGQEIVVKAVEKTNTVCVRLTAEEKKKLLEKAREMGVTASEYIRMLINKQ